MFAQPAQAQAVSPALKRSRVAVTVVFALQGGQMAAILSALPGIRNDLGASDKLLALLIAVGVYGLGVGGVDVAGNMQDGKQGAYRLSLAVLVALVATIGAASQRFFLHYGHQPHLDMDPVKVVMPWRPMAPHRAARRGDGPVLRHRLRPVQLVATVAP